MLVSASHPRATRAVVFADGSAQLTKTDWTKNTGNDSPVPVAAFSNCLKNEGGIYGAGVDVLDCDVGGGWLVPVDADDLLRRRLPF